ncbi:MAG: PP2C family serine/threonine-protein phosphatase [Candidatus Methylacidiphilales bacterium]|nr:protein phosphatase 2C domain-containing protein [Candidatus Methylacidiphilales bacterium]
MMKLAVVRCFPLELVAARYYFPFSRPPNMNSVRVESVSERLRWFGHTDRGKIRTNNEDSFLALLFDANETHYLGKIGEAYTGQKDFVFAVSDGMGGAAAGELASRIAVERITRLLPKAFKQTAVGMEAGFADVMEELFDQIHRALTFVGEGYTETKGMGATLTLCWFTPGWMFFGHIGDSRLYYFPKREPSTMKQLSHDDTYVGWLFRTGQINEREARYHPRRNVLQKALGAGHQFVDPQVGAVGYEKGDIFLLCTDGIIDGLHDADLLDVLRTGTNALSREEAQNPAKKLVANSIAQSGKDNTTALVIEVL